VPRRFVSVVSPRYGYCCPQLSWARRLLNEPRRAHWPSGVTGAAQAADEAYRHCSTAAANAVFCSGSFKQWNLRGITTAEGGKWLAARTTKPIRNLRPLAVVRTNVYRKHRARHLMFRRDIC
jgi:hypothetical protein